MSSSRSKHPSKYPTARFPSRWPHHPAASAERADAAKESVSSHHVPPVPRRPTLEAPIELVSLGVVYANLGTSPLYTLKECFNPHHGVPLNPANVLGILSLIFWSLTIVVSVKYLVFIARADNHGQGGILSLVALLVERDGTDSPRKGEQNVALILGLCAAALLYGDGVIMPTLSVYSAIEGMQHISSQTERLIMPITAAILMALFLIQQPGTTRIAKLFGPVMLLWFGCIALCGLPPIIHTPEVLRAFHPGYAVSFFLRNRLHGFIALGAVVLCVTGAEALYSHIGRFSPRAIRAGWYGVVLPTSLVSYFGQGAFLLHEHSLAFNPFYQMLSGTLLYPMVFVATLATVAASQSILSSTFSLTRQAVQLGYFPRTQVQVPPPGIDGQVYVPVVNLAWLVGCLALVVSFRYEKSSGLAAAFGLAVAATMAITSVLFGMVMRRIWGYGLFRVGLLVGLFLLVDFVFVAASLAKLHEGGFIPLLIGAVLLVIMTTWRRGRLELRRYLSQAALPLDVLADLTGQAIYRPPGAAVFLSTTPDGVPLHLLHHIKHNKCLHEKVLLLSVMTERVPVVREALRIEVRVLESGFYQAVARYGYMQTPDVPSLITGCGIFPLAALPPSYYVGRETVLPTGRVEMARWRKQLFAFLNTNAHPFAAYCGLPPNRVVELGAQIEL